MKGFNDSDRLKMDKPQGNINEPKVTENLIEKEDLGDSLRWVILLKTQEEELEFLRSSIASLENKALVLTKENLILGNLYRSKKALLKESVEITEKIINNHPESPLSIKEKLVEKNYTDTINDNEFKENEKKEASPKEQKIIPEIIPDEI